MTIDETKNRRGDPAVFYENFGEMGLDNKWINVYYQVYENDRYRKAG